MEPPQRAPEFPFPQPDVPLLPRREFLSDADITLPHNPAPKVEGSSAPQWHVHLELRAEQLVELHRMGFTGGALAWRAGMPTWQPLGARGAEAARDVDDELPDSAPAPSVSGAAATRSPAARGRLESSRRIFTPSRGRRAQLPPIIARVVPVAQPQTWTTLPSVMVREGERSPATGSPQGAEPLAPTRALSSTQPLADAAKEVLPLAFGAAPPRVPPALGPLPPAPVLLGQASTAMLPSGRLEPLLAALRPLSLAPAALDTRSDAGLPVMSLWGWLALLGLLGLSALVAAVVAVAVSGARESPLDGAASGLCSASASESRPGDEGSAPCGAGPQSVLVSRAAGPKPIAIDALPLMRGATRIPVTQSASPASPAVAPVPVESLPLSGAGMLATTQGDSAPSARERAPLSFASAGGRAAPEARVANPKASHKTVAPEPARRLEPANTQLMAQALARSALAARNCGEGPQRGRVEVTFAPSGVVRAATLLESFGEPSLSACVLRAMGRAKVPEYAGEPLTVRKTVSW